MQRVSGEFFVAVVVGVFEVLLDGGCCEGVEGVCAREGGDDGVDGAVVECGGVGGQDSAVDPIRDGLTIHV